MTEEGKEPNEQESIVLVYAGSRIGKGDKLIDLWLAVTPGQFAAGEAPGGVGDDTSDCYRSYTGKDVRRYITPPAPGGAYTVSQVKGTTKIYTTLAAYAGRWPGRELCLQWQLKHREAQAMAGSRKRAAKESYEEEFAPLGPFRERYRKLVSREQKGAMLAAVIAFITN